MENVRLSGGNLPNHGRFRAHHSAGAVCLSLPAVLSHFSTLDIAFALDRTMPSFEEVSSAPFAESVRNCSSDLQHLFLLCSKVFPKKHAVYVASERCLLALDLLRGHLDGLMMNTTIVGRQLFYRGLPSITSEINYTKDLKKKSILPESEKEHIRAAMVKLMVLVDKVGGWQGHFTFAPFVEASRALGAQIDLFIGRAAA
jgi:hypothetical protein